MSGTVTDTQTMQTAAVANGNGTIVNTDGYSGQRLLLITNGAGTATLTIQTSLDAAFTTAQDTVVPGVTLLWDSTAGTNTTRAVASGVISIAANKSYLYSMAECLPRSRAVISAASGLGAGTNDTGLTVKFYGVPS